MDFEIYKIIKSTLDLDNLYEEYKITDSIIKEIVINENIQFKVDLLREFLKIDEEIFKDKEIAKESSLYDRYMICLIYYKLFFDNVLMLDESVMEKFLYVYTNTKLTGSCNIKINDTTKFLISLNDDIEYELIYSYSNKKDITEDSFDCFIYRIEEILDCYFPRKSNRWDNIERNKYDESSVVESNIFKKRVLELLHNSTQESDSNTRFMKLLETIKDNGNIRLYATLKMANFSTDGDFVWNLEFNNTLYPFHKKIIDENMELIEKILYSISGKKFVINVKQI